MKTNIHWLKEFVAFDDAPDALADALTMAGLEVDAVIPVADDLEGVVVAEILDRQPHPNADRLSLCRITDGKSEHEIVCGAPNARAGIRVPFAPVGTQLPGDLKIKSAEIRGVSSSGMLCSAKELALSDDAAGLLELDSSAQVGQALRDHLKLDDHILDVDLTPNRGDCFSVLGIAREIAARNGDDPLEEGVDCIEAGIDETFEVEIIDTPACPRFAGRVIDRIDSAARTPDWMKERLRRAGLRPIQPIVDVTNYVMLELGQPLHAYRLDRLRGPIEVRFAKREEPLTLLDETELKLDDDALVIADQTGAIGLAGIMGGASTAVDDSTDAILLESAFFAPGAIQGRARRYGLHTDASVRFERGVDPSGQERAIERATALLLEISGGRCGPIVVAEDLNQTPVRKSVTLRSARVASLLGIDVQDADVESALGRLGMTLEKDQQGWQVTPPGFRFDIEIEEDLIEELGRMIGYDEIPASPMQAAVHPGSANECLVSADTLADTLIARGYSEVVSFAFTESAALARLTGEDNAIRLANPLSQELDVMRSTLWPGLLRAARLNLSHQRVRCRLFELGTVFSKADHGVAESACIAGLVSGSRLPEHWEGAAPVFDFYDLKGDVEALLENWNSAQAVSYRPQQHAALNPVRTAAIYKQSVRIGWLGELHPALIKEYDFRDPVVLFELDLGVIAQSELPHYVAYSRFPSSRRDIAVVVNEKLSVTELIEHIADTLGPALLRHEIFDVYRGPGVDKGRKSIGIGLILNNASRTLNDKETDDMIRQVVRRLEHDLGATIRN